MKKTFFWLMKLLAGKQPVAQPHTGKTVAILAEYNGKFDDQSPATVAAIDSQISRDIAYASWSHFRMSDEDRRRAAASLVQTHSGLILQMMSHPDGYVREMALSKTDQALESPFAVAMVIWRMNDWVAPVRHAALAFAKRNFSRTDNAVLAECLCELIVPAQSWRRWETDSMVQEIISCIPGLGIPLAKEIAGSKSGPAPRSLRYLLKTKLLDPYLPELLATGSQPGVRAVAAETLIRGSASWASGRKKVWIDKPNGIFRFAPNHVHRPLSISYDPNAMLQTALLDKSAIVRRSAFSAAMAKPVQSDELLRIAKSLADDPSPSIQERANWVIKKFAD